MADQKLDSAGYDLALRRLRVGEAKLNARKPSVQKRERYVRGDQDLPFAPQGVSNEYHELRRMAVANWIGLVATAPTQRLRMEGIRTSLGDKVDDRPDIAGGMSRATTVDRRLWTHVFQANKWDVRQSHLYLSMTKHGRGIASVWPNRKNAAQPIVRTESFEQVHIQPDPEDPLTPQYAVKVYTVDDGAPDNGLILPAGVTMGNRRLVGIVYDHERFARFERPDVGGLGGQWELVASGTHPMREVPFALFDYKLLDDGTPWSALDHMMHQQDALNTIRFNALLAMQFSAYRQRAVSGFDPRVYDENGEIVYRTDPDGIPILGPDGEKLPILNSPGRVGVDRMLVFPGVETKIYDLPESNLKNYVEVHSDFLSSFFATGQIPPQYLLTRMANLSGDALAGAESTFVSLLKEMQLAAGEGNEQVARLAWRAMGETEEFDPAAECLWADAEARSFSQVVDGIGKLIADGFPRRAAWEMIPGATRQRVDEWIEMYDDESLDVQIRNASLGLDSADLGRPPIDVE